MGLLSGTWSRLRRPPGRTPLDRAIDWFKANRAPDGGIVPHNGLAVGSQEVTGYIIPTLYNVGERDLALDLARWQASVQRPDGGFSAVDGVAYTFDTAQAIRGYLAVLDDLPDLEPNIRRACNFIVGQIGRDGRVHTPSYDQWSCADGSTFSEYANLYVLPPLLTAGRWLQEPAYVDAASRALAYYTSREDLVDFKPEMGTMSHIFGYMMEALAELGEVERARRGLAQAAAIQAESGAIPAYPGARWVCSTGMAQLALAWYRLNDYGPADRAVEYLKTVQRPSGGFFGSHGPGATYFPDEEISWAVKFFVDCLALQASAVPQS